MPRRGALSTAFDTPLTPEETNRYQSWRAGLPERLQGTDDYDLQGAWLGNAKEAGNGHLEDTWKKPNHMTFSSGSQYSTPEAPGGDWRQAAGDDWVFWASPENLRHHSASELGAYFRQYEPTSAVVLPSDYRLPPR
jgi:hypothetical protein